MFGLGRKSKIKKKLTKKFQSQVPEIIRQAEEKRFSESPLAQHNTPSEMQERDHMRKRVSEDVEESKNARNQARGEGERRAEQIFSKQYTGLSPEERGALQSEANKHIHRHFQTENRNLLGEQSRRGILGKGGIGFAQQKELQRLASEARGESERDINKLDIEQRNRKMLGTVGLAEGEAAQNALDRQLAENRYDHEEERKRARRNEEMANRNYMSRL
jgi:hypothetical protein